MAILNKRILSAVVNFFDSDYFPDGAVAVSNRPKKVELDRCIPFVFLHTVCLGAFLTGVSKIAITTCLSLYFLRIFVITAFYHRYFSHKSFKTSRIMQFLFALIGTTAAQRGPLWWAAHHRKHHRFSDHEGDIHSPVQNGFWWSHIGWITSSANMPTDYAAIPDFAKFPELRFLNRFDWLPPTLLAVSLAVAGEVLKYKHPDWHTSGPQMVVWGFFISTVALFHVTCSINSLSHLFGYSRYETNDSSKNNFLLAVLTFGEGWHNNHHKFPGTVRQGFFWWELDITYLILKVLAALKIVSHLRPIPQNAFIANQTANNRAIDKMSI